MARTVSTIEQELADFVKAKQFKDEPRQIYLGRLSRLVNKVDNKEWEAKLSDEAKEWTNKAADALTQGNSIPDFDGTTPVAADEDEDEEEVEMTEKTTKKTAAKDDPKKKVIPATDAKMKKVSLADEPKKKGPNTTGLKTKKNGVDKETGLVPGLTTNLKLILAEDPNMSSDEYLKRAQKQKIEASLNTMRAIRADFRHTLRVLDHCKMLKAGFSG